MCTPDISKINYVIYFWTHCNRRNSSESPEQRWEDELDFLLRFCNMFQDPSVTNAEEGSRVVSLPSPFAESQTFGECLAQHYNTFLLGNRTSDNIHLMQIHSQAWESKKFRIRNSLQYQFLHYTEEETNVRRLCLASSKTVSGWAWNRIFASWLSIQVASSEELELHCGLMPSLLIPNVHLL